MFLQLMSYKILSSCRFEGAERARKSFTFSMLFLAMPFKALPGSKTELAWDAVVSLVRGEVDRPEGDEKINFMM